MSEGAFTILHHRQRDWRSSCHSMCNDEWDYIDIDIDIDIGIGIGIDMILALLFFFVSELR